MDCGKGLLSRYACHLHLRKDCQLAKPNYDFAKRQKELAKKAKKEEKRLKKLAAGETPDPEGAPEAEDDTEEPAAPAPQG